MLKIANQVLDFQDDLDKSILKKLASSGRLSGDIRVLSDEQRANLDDTDFALSVITKKASKINKFPIDSKDSAWLSNEYFDMTHRNLPEEAALIAAYNIKVACERFKIKTSPAVEALSEKTASSNIYVEKDIVLSERNISIRDEGKSLEKFAAVKKIGDNYTHAQYVFNTVGAIKTACEFFKENSKKMDVEYRHKYAAAIQKRAGELAFEVTEPEVKKYASDSYSAHLDSHLASRRELMAVKDPIYTESLSKLASMKNALTPTEFAGMLHNFDKSAGIDRYYGGYLTDPYLSTFAAMANPNLIKLGSMKIAPEAMKGFFTEKYAKVKQYFGSSIADQLKKEGSVAFESLPNDAKEVLAGIADGTL